MCGIAAALSKSKNIVNDLLNSLEKLEYRGYDSAGIAIINNNTSRVVKSIGKIQELRDTIESVDDFGGRIGIGHTRWATHGTVTLNNAHPHCCNGVTIVHNGIFENFEKHKKMLQDAGHVFKSETDSEVIAHMIYSYIEKGASFIDALKKVTDKIEGTYAIVAMCDNEPNVLIGTKRGSPMAFAENSDGETFYIASDATALSGLSDDVTYLEEGDIIVCKLSQDKFVANIYDEMLNKVSRPKHKNELNLSDVSKSGFETFMLKEINEEPIAVEKTYHSSSKIDIVGYSRISIIACGTSSYAGILARYWIEDMLGIPTDVEVASEFRYRNPVMPKGTLYVFISQSGETLDTLCALRMVKERGFRTLSIVNVYNSSIFRESDDTFQTLAGVEMGVASTKAFLAQLMAFLVIFLGKSKININKIVSDLKTTLSLKDQIRKVAESVANSKSMLYIGRGESYPIALEGALKIKEISYISSEGYQAGEMKHGPIALIDENVYTIAIAPLDKYFEKTLSNAQEVLARNGRLVLFTSKEAEKSLTNIANNELVSVIYVPDGDNISNPFIMASCVHQLAYYTAMHKGLDVDKPRNLAKSVTVE